MDARPPIVGMDRISMSAKRFLWPPPATILIRCELLALAEPLRNRQTAEALPIVGDDDLVTAAHKSSQLLR
jgi:hypothetical protein